MRASAFSPEVARLLGVRVGRMLTLGWALAAMVGALAGVLIAGTAPNYMNPNGFDALLIYGFTAAVIGGLDSPIGAVVGGLLLGIALAFLDNYVSNEIDTFYVAGAADVVLMVRPIRAVHPRHDEKGMTVPGILGRSTLLRHLLLAVVAGGPAPAADREPVGVPELPGRDDRLPRLRHRRADRAHRPVGSDLASATARSCSSAPTRWP